MKKLREIADGCLTETKVDYVGLWQIANRVRREVDASSNERIKQLSLEVVRLILAAGLYPGDYDKSGFRFWDDDDVEAVVARIEREWNSLPGDPSVADICWFDVLTGPDADR